MSNTNTIDPKDMNGAEDALNELARRACSFMVTLVEQRSIATFSDGDSMNAIIEELTRCVLTTFMYYFSFSQKKTSQRNEAGSWSRQQNFFSKINDASSP